jgi:hypothetical protein
MRLVRHSERSEESLFGDNPGEIPHSADSVRNDKARFFGVASEGSSELFFVEFQGSGIDAVAQTHGPRAIVKDMA